MRRVDGSQRSYHPGNFRIHHGKAAIQSALGVGTYKFYSWVKGEDYGLQIDTRSISGGVNADQNARLSVFNEIWLDRSYIGKTIRFSFRAKASENGSIRLTLNQRQKYAFNNFPGLDKTADLTTEWQTFTFEFVVTEAMYDCITNGDDPNGIEAQGLALGIRFSDFSNGTKYDPAQLVFRDFIVNTVEMPPEATIFRDSYDMSATKPTVDTRGYGKQLATITDGVLQIDLTKDSQAPNPNAYTRVTALDNLFADVSNKGKTFVITFKAKASEAGLMDFAFNKFGSFNTYSDAGRTYNAQYDLTTEWQTFNFTFVATADMFTTHASTNLNLAFRLYNGFGGANGAYNPAQVYIDDITVTENPYVRSVDYTFDMSTTKPTVDTRGYGKQLASIADGVLQIDLTKDSQAPNANAYTRIEALNQVITAENIGKSFIITFRAKATQTGQLDFAFNKLGSFNTYTYGGRTYKDAYQMTTEYQTFTFAFTVSEDMVTTHAATNINIALRLYNGFGGSTGAYYPAQVYIDDLRIYEDMTVSAPTIDVTGAVAVSGQGNSDSLNVYADDSATGAPNIQKTYLGYDLGAVTTSYGATLKVNLSGANGETVRVYLISGATLTAPVTYANAPVPSGSPVASFVAVNGLNTVDVSKAIADNVGKNVVIVLAIEEPSDQIQVTSTPVLTVSEEYHNYTSESQKHEAKAPTYKVPGNVEFYTCEGCDKLYVKNGDQFVEVTIDDVIIPMLECTEHNFVDGTCTNCGKQDAHTCSGGTATCQKRAECSTCGKEYGELADHTAEVVSGKAPTCTANGLTDGEKCSVCGTVTVTQTTISALGHTEITVAGKAATCTASGLTDGKKCSVCGTVIVTQVTITAYGHNWTPATTTAPKTCLACGITEGDKLPENSSPAYSETLYVSYINVGQGDSILIKLGDCDILIDAGVANQGSTVSKYLKAQGVDDIELMINTHPDADHCGGLTTVLNDFVVEEVWASPLTKTTAAYKNFASAVSKEGLTMETPSVGTIYTYEYMTLTVLYNGAGTSDSNDSSIVVMLQYGSFRFLFTGDISSTIESKLVSNSNIDLSCDVLKVAHHGSKYSSNMEFLRATGAKYGVICVGDNSYGHPTSSTLNNLKNAGISVYRTDQNGNVVFSSNGATLTTPGGTTLAEGSASYDITDSTSQGSITFIGNKESKVFHLPTCGNLPDVSKRNYLYNYWFIVNCIGYRPCQVCLKNYTP